MYGYNKPYDQLLVESGLTTLKARREATVMKFVKKCLDNPIYAGWFPRNQNPTSERHPKIYKEEFARTDRLYNSPIFHMRRVLNGTEHIEPTKTNYLDLGYLFDDIFGP